MSLRSAALLQAAPAEQATQSLRSRLVDSVSLRSEVFWGSNYQNDTLGAKYIDGTFFGLLRASDREDDTVVETQASRGLMAL